MNPALYAKSIDIPDFAYSLYLQRDSAEWEIARGLEGLAQWGNADLIALYAPSGIVWGDARSLYQRTGDLYHLLTNTSGEETRALLFQRKVSAAGEGALSPGSAARLERRFYGPGRIPGTRLFPRPPHDGGTIAVKRPGACLRPAAGRPGQAPSGRSAYAGNVSCVLPGFRHTGKGFTRSGSALPQGNGQNDKTETGTALLPGNLFATGAVRPLSSWKGVHLSQQKLPEHKRISGKRSAAPEKTSGTAGA